MIPGMKVSHELLKKCKDEHLGVFFDAAAAAAAQD